MNTTAMQSALKKFFFVFFPIAVFVRAIVDFFLHLETYQWDTRGYYRCPNFFFNSGIDFKTPEQLKETWACVYPVASFLFFKPLTWFTEDQAVRIFLAVKILFLILLFFVWFKFFLSENLPKIYFPFFALVAFYGTLHLDFRAGNISIIEQALIWSAFAAFISRRFVLFALILGLASIFKIVPIVFLGMLFFVNDKKRVQAFVFGVLVILFSFTWSYFYSPTVFVYFFKNASERMVESGFLSPSSLALFRDVVNILNSKLSLRIPVITGGVLFYIWTAIIAFFSYPVFKKTKDLRALVIFSTLAFAIVHPRMKDYAYILLIVPAYWVIFKTKLQFGPVAAMLILSLFVNQAPMPPWVNTFYEVFWPYYPLFVAVFLWNHYRLFLLKKNANTT